MSQIRRIMPYFLSILSAFLLASCSTKTVISRTDQLALLETTQSIQETTTAETIPVSTQPEASPTTVTTEAPVPTETEATKESGANAGNPPQNTVPATLSDSIDSPIPVETTQPQETTLPGETTTPPSTEITEPVPVNLEIDILANINQYRSSPLVLDSGLSALAAIRAQECCTYWSHTRPDGTDFSTVVTESYTTVSENLYKTSSVPDGYAPVQMWYHAEKQRANMCSSNFSRVGIGIYAADEMTYIVCLFVG